VYVPQIQPIRYHAPWDLTFDQRMALMMRGSPRAAYFYTVPDTSTFRYRAYNVAQSLAASGVRRGPSVAWFTENEFERMGRVLEACDVLVLCRNSLYTDRVARLAAQARALNRRIFFDVDDLVFDPAYIHLLVDTLGLNTRNSEVWDYWFAYVGRVGATYALCDGALVTNNYLAAHATAWSGKPAHVIPNFLNREQQEVSDQVWDTKTAGGWARDGRTHLAYFSGSPSHNRDFDLVVDAIARLMDEDDSLWLRVVGFLESRPELARHHARIEVLPLQDFMNLQREIGAIEVNLVPLQDNPFSNCKSELKWFEAAVTGALTVASPTHAYRRVIDHGRNGWLSHSHTWEATLREILCAVDDYRVDVAARARAEARDRYGWDRQAATIEAALFSGW
jgi:glycosyltransferase involved in cell wall biosynthesis